jgi:hypothetical protein
MSARDLYIASISAGSAIDAVSLYAAQTLQQVGFLQIDFAGEGFQIDMQLVAQ